MAMKRGKTLMAKALVRRSIKKAKRHGRRAGVRAETAKKEAARIAEETKAAEFAARIAAEKLLAEEEAARAATLGLESEAA